VQPRRILVVEDDAAIRRGIADALAFTGYEVLQSGHGDEGLRIALSAPVDLLLLDVVLPGTGGFEILRSVRSARTTCRSSSSPPAARRQTASADSASAPTTTW